ncbi:MAG: tandem-95 repeat protein [Candidatus Accumulibacter sp.]|nr:tandem-95 repeat protein [Accumulibacter sp.]
MLTDTDTLAIAVTPVADIVADTVITDEDTPISFNAITGSHGASADNFENAGRVVSAVTQGAHGSVAFAADGTLTYTPDADYHGPDSFTYTVTSGGVEENHHRRRDRQPVNDLPVNTLPLAQSTLEDTPLVITGLAVADVDNASLSTTLSLPAGSGTLTVTGGSGATVTGDGSGTVTIAGTTAQINAALASLTYTPTADFNTGAGSLDLTIATTDGVLTDTDTLAIAVTPVADIVADTVITDEDTPISFNAITGSHGASADNFENAGRVVSAVTQGAHGSVAFAADGTLTYTPDADYHGSDSFTYTVTSGGVEETTTVDVTVNPVNDLPVNTLPPGPEHARGHAPRDHQARGRRRRQRQSLDHPEPAGGQRHADRHGRQRRHGHRRRQRHGNDRRHDGADQRGPGFAHVHPTADFNTGAGSLDLTIATTDGVLTDTDTLAIAVTPVADIVADTVITDEDTPISFNAITGSHGASADNFENAGRVVSAVTQGAHGSVAFAADGTLTYTPDADYHGPDSFTYTVTSGGVEETTTVDVTVNPVNDLPVNTLPLAQSTLEDTPLVITGLAVADVDNASLSTTLSLPAGSGTLTVTGGGATITSNGTATVTIAGTAAQINAALASLTYTRPPTTIPAPAVSTSPSPPPTAC